MQRDCENCGYSLEGLPSQVCPECGTVCTHAVAVWTRRRRREFLMALCLPLTPGFVAVQLTGDNWPFPLGFILLVQDGNPISLTTAVIIAFIEFGTVLAFYSRSASTRRRYVNAITLLTAGFCTLILIWARRPDVVWITTALSSIPALIAVTVMAFMNNYRVAK